MSDYFHLQYLQNQEPTKLIYNLFKSEGSYFPADFFFASKILKEKWNGQVLETIDLSCAEGRTTVRGAWRVVLNSLQNSCAVNSTEFLSGTVRATNSMPAPLNLNLCSHPALCDGQSPHSRARGVVLTYRHLTLENENQERELEPQQELHRIW